MAKPRQQRDTQQAIHTLTDCVRLMPKALDTLDLLATALRAHGYDGTMRTGVSDPTPAQAAAIGRWLRKQERINQAISHIVHEANRLHADLSSVPSDVDTRRIAELHRCSGLGQPGFDEPDGWKWIGAGGEECWRIKSTRDGLCERCRQRRDEWRRRQRPDAELTAA